MSEAEQGGADAAAAADTPATDTSAAASLLTGGEPAKPAGTEGDKPAPTEGKSFLEGVEGLSDDVKAWATTRGFPTIRDALEAGYHNEKLLGADKVALPKDSKDAEGLDRVLKALGKPDSETAYGLDKLDGADPAFAGAMGKVFLKAGVLPSQAAALAEGWQTFQAEALKAEQADFATKSAQGVDELRKEWGGKFDSNIEIGRRAVQQFGMADAIPALEKGLGSRGMLQLLQKIGAGLAEGDFESGGNPSKGFSLSPDQARARITTLTADKAFGAKYLNKDAEAVAEMDRLHRIAYPDGAGQTFEKK